jgi:hypothetical protein
MFARRYWIAAIVAVVLGAGFAIAQNTGIYNWQAGNQAISGFISVTTSLGNDLRGFLPAPTVVHFTLNQAGNANGNQINNLANGTANNDAVNLSQLLNPPPVTNGIFNTITPKNDDGTDSIGAFNGARNNEVNVADQPGFSSWTGSIQCAVTSGVKAITCSTIGSTPLAAGDYVAVFGAGPNATTVTPTGIEVSPLHTLSAPGGADGTTFASGCTVQNAYAWPVSGSNIMSVSNVGMYEVGDVLSVAGAFSNVAVTVVNVGAGQLEMASSATGSGNGVAITGAGCSTTRHYEVFAIDAYGGWSSPTAVQTVGSTANGLTQSNWVSFQVATQSGAIAYVLAGYEDGSSSNMHIIDVQVPSYTFISPNNTNWWDNDALVGNYPTKAAPTTITLHDFGTISAFGRDWNQGNITITGRQAGTYGAVPSGSYPEILFTKIDAISGTTVTLHDMPSQSGTFNLKADVGPVIEAAKTAVCDSNLDCGKIYFPNYRGTNQGYSIVTPVVLSDGIGLQLEGAGTVYAGDASQTGSAFALDGMFLYSGPIGGTIFALYNQMRPHMQNMGFGALTTGGVGLDIDQTVTGTGHPTSTQPTIEDVNLPQASVVARISNIGTDNTEFGYWKNVYGGITNPSGYVGLLINFGNALNHVCVNCNFWGQFGLWVQNGFAAYGGQFGGPYMQTAIWSPHYQAGDSIHLEKMRVEHSSRVMYSPTANGGSAIMELELVSDNFTGINVLGDGIVMALPGTGVTKLDQTFFNTVTWGQGAGGAGQCSDPQISAFIATWQPGFTVINSSGVTYDADITPFSGTLAYVNGKGDGAMTCGWAPISDPVSPSQSITIQGPFPFTIPATPGWTGRACGTIAAGGNAAFPVTPTVGGQFYVSVNSGVLQCTFGYSVNGTANTLSTGIYENVNSGNGVAPCSTTSTNINTANVSLSAGNNLVVTNGFPTAENVCVHADND